MSAQMEAAAHALSDTDHALLNSNDYRDTQEAPPSAPVPSTSPEVFFAPLTGLRLGAFSTLGMSGTGCQRFNFLAAHWLPALSSEALCTPSSTPLSPLSIYHQLPLCSLVDLSGADPTCLPRSVEAHQLGPLTPGELAQRQTGGYGPSAGSRLGARSGRGPESVRELLMGPPT